MEGNCRRLRDGWLCALRCQHCRSAPSASVCNPLKPAMGAYRGCSADLDLGTAATAVPRAQSDVSNLSVRLDGLHLTDLT